MKIISFHNFVSFGSLVSFAPKLGRGVYLKIIADTHCHTVASSHAYSTVVENANSARNAGLLAMAITDHTGKIPDSPSAWYFDNLKIIPNEIFGVRILKGIECNVINSEGLVDLPKLKTKLDIVIASIHEFTFQKKHGVSECTNAWLGVAGNPNVNIIGHSGTPGFEYDFEKVIKFFKEKGKIVEINSNSYKVRPGSEKNCCEIARLCKKYEVPVTVSSDSHYCDYVGNFNSALKILKSADFPEELVVNSSIERLSKYVNNLY